MSGGPPHHPHSRQSPAANAAWNHLQQVPSFFPRPQHAHMSTEHPLLHQPPPTWHTPSTDPVKPPYYNLEQVLGDRAYPAAARHPAPGVDLSLAARNGGGGQNGEVPTTPISLSVRDTNKINSLPPGALGLQAMELTKCPSPGVKSMSPGVKSVSPGLAEAQQGSPKSVKRPKKVESILEKLNQEKTVEAASEPDKPTQSVIVQAASTSSHDENSNSSSILNVPTPNATREDDAVSPYSNEDSVDNSKSRRKRKPSKTVRVSKEEEKKVEEKDCATEVVVEKESERRRSSSEPPVSPTQGHKARRKTSSESETIANIAAMVQESLAPKETTVEEKKEEVRPVSVSVIKTKENLQELTTEVVPQIVPQVQTSTPCTIITPAQKKATTNPQFVEVENKLEEMFAGIDDSSDPLKTEEQQIEQLLDDTEPSTSQQDVTSTSNDFSKTKRAKRKGSSTETTPKKKKSKGSLAKSPKKKRSVNGKQINMKVDVKDVYAYDSGSNASSSRSRGPFIHIKGPRDSPLSVSVVNAPLNEEDLEKRMHKTKKFHDDSEYRHKVRSKGLHCSTLSNKYDAQTRDASWICAFCKRGPHTTDLKGQATPNFSEKYSAPGDLFGPYTITNRSPEFERRLDDPYDLQFKSKKVKRCLEANRVSGKKSKRKHSENYDGRISLDSVNDSDVYLGITDVTGQSYEVWAHENCIVWSQGVYLIGPKIVGLEEAIWTCCNVPCRRCHLKGANICCLKRGCPNVMHFPCAQMSDWQLEEDTFRVLCAEHKTK